MSAPRLGHGDRLVGVEDVGCGEQTLACRGSDHLDFEVEAHSGLFEVLPKESVVEANRRKVLHAGESNAGELVEEPVHETEGVGATHAGQHRRLFDDRQHLVGHLDDDGIGVTVGGVVRRASHARPCGSAPEL